MDLALSNITSPKVSQSSPEAGSLWLTSVDGTWLSGDGNVMSAFYHPTKKHSASTIGKLGTKRSVAEAGKWAVSIQTRGAFGNKAFYNTLE